MLNRDQIIQDAVEAVIEQTDLNPGEVNSNISQVMKTMEEANERFRNMDDHVSDLLTASQELDETGTQMAQSSVNMARAAQNLAESVDNLTETQQQMVEDMDELQETLDKLETHMPEE